MIKISEDKNSCISNSTFERERHTTAVKACNDKTDHVTRLTKIKTSEKDGALQEDPQ